MHSTLAFAPTAEDLDEDFFGVPVVTFAPPPAPSGEAPRGDDPDEAPRKTGPETAEAA